MHPVILERRQLLQNICAPAAKAAAATAISSWLFTTPSWAKPRTTVLKRLVCVGGSLTEIIYALNLQGHLIAIDTTSTYPMATKKLPSVGYARALSLEGVLSMRPQLLLVTEDAGPPQVLRQISHAGVQVKVLKADHRYEGLIDRVRAIGFLLGAEGQSERLIKEINHGWQQYQQYQQDIDHAMIDKNENILTKEVPSQQLKAMFIMAHSPQQIMVAGHSTSAHAIMNYLYLDNAFKAVQGYKPLTPESVIAGRANIILLTDQGLQAQGGMQGILRLPGVMQTPAARHRQIYSREANHLLGFGPRLPSMLHSLVKEIHAIK
jgi:iron complex transport system substrate-binding protein